MKTNLTKITSAATLVAGLMTLTMSIVPTSSFAQDRAGNGGGGVKVNGVYKTFYSAGIYVNPMPEENIPGAELFKKTIMNLGGNNEDISKILRAGLPLGDRTFYKVNSDKFSETTMKNLIMEYAKVVNQDPNNLTIFAITNTEDKETFLLPSFYKLNEKEQAAILFHEAYWVLKPKTKYAEVINAEVSFQRFLEKKEKGVYDHTLPRIIGKLLNQVFYSLQSAYKFDQDTKNFNSVVTEHGIAYEEINDLLRDTNSSVLHQVKYSRANYNQYIILPYSLYAHGAHLQKFMHLSEKYPTSHFLIELINALNTEGIRCIQFNIDVDKSKLYEIQWTNSGEVDMKIKDIYYKISTHSPLFPPAECYN